MYSFLIPRLRKMALDELVLQFVMRLHFTLLAAQPPIECQPGTVRAIRGGNTSLIGTMNNMVYLLSAPKSPLLKEDDEQILNDTTTRRLRDGEAGNSGFTAKLRH
jgi:hypothetical protein